MACTEFQGIRYRIDREIDEQHVLEIYQNNRVLDYIFILFQDVLYDARLIPTTTYYGMALRGTDRKFAVCVSEEALRKRESVILEMQTKIRVISVSMLL